MQFTSYGMLTLLFVKHKHSQILCKLLELLGISQESFTVSLVCHSNQAVSYVSLPALLVVEVGI